MCFDAVGPAHARAAGAPLGGSPTMTLVPADPRRFGITANPRLPETVNSIAFLCRRRPRSVAQGAS
jgi:hypothetical protein